MILALVCGSSIPLAETAAPQTHSPLLTEPLAGLVLQHLLLPTGGARPARAAPVEERHSGRLLPAALRAPVQKPPAAPHHSVAVWSAARLDGCSWLPVRILGQSRLEKSSDWLSP